MEYKTAIIPCPTVSPFVQLDIAKCNDLYHFNLSGKQLKKYDSVIAVIVCANIKYARNVSLTNILSLFPGYFINEGYYIVNAVSPTFLMNVSLISIWTLNNAQFRVLEPFFPCFTLWSALIYTITGNRTPPTNEGFVMKYDEESVPCRLQALICSQRES